MTGRWLAQSAWIVLLFTVACASVWAASPAFTGHREPWDDDGPYFLVALAVVGFCGGLLSPRPSLLMAFGSFLGQLGYMVIFGRIGPLILLGVIFLAGYSLVPAFAGVGGVAARRLVIARRARLSR